MSFNVIFYFLPVIVIFLAACTILVYCKYKCVRGSREEAGPPQESVVPAFVAPAGVPEWVTSPRLLCMHYYLRSMFTLVRETALHYFPGPQWEGSTETVDLGFV